jgi:triosephosphate isomerase
MRKPLVAGNWKMNGSLASITPLLEGIKSGVDVVTTAEVAVCPPSIYIAHVASLLQDTGIAWGAQDVNDHESGAHTGEISASMLKDFGCKYVIVGHSERRNIYGESDAFTARKFATARKAGLIPILCVGELLEEREQGVTEEVVGRQLDAVIDLEGVGALADAVIAYEPVWAIGTGKTATPVQAQEVHAFIRNRLAGEDSGMAGQIRILYGGSVKGSNAAELFQMPDIDGGLIGGASLDAEEFLSIARAANR